MRRLEEEIRKLKSAPAGADDPTDPKAKPNPKDSDEASSAFSGAEYFFKVGKYETVLDLFDEIPRDPKRGSA